VDTRLTAGEWRAVGAFIENLKTQRPAWREVAEDAV
jgi:hypothetical protein